MPFSPFLLELNLRIKENSGNFGSYSVLQVNSLQRKVGLVFVGDELYKFECLGREKTVNRSKTVITMGKTTSIPVVLVIILLGVNLS